MYDPNYITTYALQTKPTSVALPAGIAVEIVGLNFNRHFLTLQVTGTGAATFGFGSAPTVGGGVCLDPASAPGGQGGSYEFKSVIPYDAIWAISAVGTTVVVVEGF
jgi:hypothetical protein